MDEGLSWTTLLLLVSITTIVLLVAASRVQGDDDP
jgi:hypothetical protein